MSDVAKIRNATREEIDRAVESADASLEALASASPDRIATLLDTVAQQIEALGDELVECATRETALPTARIVGERARTTNQLRMFGSLVRDGAWKGVCVDLELPDRQPQRRPDLRRTVIPVGPVAVWAASNFPLAFSVAGGDTASALAAGCPVVVKAHPGHPETSELTAKAVRKAIDIVGLPEWSFSLLQGERPEVSLALVQHPKIAAGAFTGSLRAGRALFDAANRRPEPIPFFAEMGSVNPVFVLEAALAERGAAIAEGLFQSVTLGVGQFCTCPGLVFAVEGPTYEAFAQTLRSKFEGGAVGTMLTGPVAHGYHAGARILAELPGVTTCGANTGDVAKRLASPMLFETTDAVFHQHELLRQEVFGPSTVLVRCASSGAMLEAARHLEGSLTATLHATQGDYENHRALFSVLTRKAGRIVFNGFPTGVEVCASMQHGGPYPATSDARYTSVGSAAIQRFVRPICFQDCPPQLLPLELQQSINT